MSVTFPKGFRASGTAAGIKTSGDLDLAIVASTGDVPYVAVGTFTTNLAAAAPVLVSKRTLDLGGGKASAVLLSSGNANAATGETGFAHALASAAALSVALGCDPAHVLVCSTGLIGIALPVEKILEAIPGAVSNLGEDDAAGRLSAEALMTTDTFPKVATFEIEGARFGGIAKGAAMIAPNMATMLAIITTDAVATRANLQSALSEAVEQSFNRITIDGCTSTNDSVIVLGSGASGVELAKRDLDAGIAAICSSLANQIVFDAEGSTKLVRITVTGAANDGDALKIARKVAESSLVKCSLFGADPYWGRVISEVGSSGVALDMDNVSVAYGQIVVYANATENSVDRESLAKVMASREIDLDICVGDRGGRGTIVTADLTPAYIAENMRTS